MNINLLLKAKASAKSLKWIVNQIPNDLGDEPEEKILKTIRHYCDNAANILNELSSTNQISCKKCNSVAKPYLQHKGQHVGLYCSKCFTWQKWVTQDEIINLGLSDNDFDDLPF